MLAVLTASVLGFLAILVARATGEHRYEKPDLHPQATRVGVTMAVVINALAIAVARCL